MVLRFQERDCRGSARRPSHFCFGKSGQNHLDRGMALRVPSAVHRPRQRANSLRSNTARFFSWTGCTARPCHQARVDHREIAAQLAGLTHGPLAEKSVPPWGQPAGVDSTVRLFISTSAWLADLKVGGGGKLESQIGWRVTNRCLTRGW